MAAGRTQDISENPGAVAPTQPDAALVEALDLVRTAERSLCGWRRSLRRDWLDRAARLLKGRAA